MGLYRTSQYLGIIAVGSCCTSVCVCLHACVCILYSSLILIVVLVHFASCCLHTSNCMCMHTCVYTATGGMECFASTSKLGQMWV